MSLTKSCYIWIVSASMTCVSVTLSAQTSDPNISQHRLRSASEQTVEQKPTKLPRQSVSPNSQRRAEPQARVQPLAATPTDPVAIAPRGVSASVQANFNIPTQSSGQSVRTTTFITGDGERITTQSFGDASAYSSSRDALGNTKRSGNRELYSGPEGPTGTYRNITVAGCTTHTYGSQSYTLCEK